MQSDFASKHDRIGFFVGATILQLFASIALWTLRDDQLSMRILVFSAFWLFLLYCQFRILYQKQVMLPDCKYPVGLSENLIITSVAGIFGAVSSIILDLDHQRIHFQNCFTRKSFLARPVDWFSCGFSEVTEVFVANPAVTGLMICTEGGKAYFQSTHGRSSELIEHLRNLAPQGNSGRRKFQITQQLWVLGSIGGILFGWVLTPIDAPDLWLAVTMTSGAILFNVVLWCLFRFKLFRRG